MLPPSTLSPSLPIALAGDNGVSGKSSPYGLTLQNPTSEPLPLPLQMDATNPLVPSQQTTTDNPLALLQQTTATGSLTPLQQAATTGPQDVTTLEVPTVARPVTTTGAPLLNFPTALGREHAATGYNYGLAASQMAPLTISTTAPTTTQVWGQTIFSTIPATMPSAFLTPVATTSFPSAAAWTPYSASTERPMHSAGFVTLAQVQALLDRQKEPMPTTMDIRSKFTPAVQQAMYPAGYSPPKFEKFDGKNGNPREHITRYLDSLGHYVLHEPLRMREFSKSLKDRAFTWYANLPAESVRDWDNLVAQFYAKFFHVEQRTTVLSLTKTIQDDGEALMTYIDKFRDKAIECQENVTEEALVRICIDGMHNKYKAYLVNSEFKTFTRLCESAQRLSEVVQPSLKIAGWKDKRKGATVAVAEKVRKGISVQRSEGEPPSPRGCLRILVV